MVENKTKLRIEILMKFTGENDNRNEPDQALTQHSFQAVLENRAESTSPSFGLGYNSSLPAGIL
jgi:hypothetical protein